MVNRDNCEAVLSNFALMTIYMCENSSYIKSFAVNKLLVAAVTSVDSLVTGFNLDAYWWRKIEAVPGTILRSQSHLN